MKLLILIAITILTVPAFGQTMIKGKVTDADGQSIPMANVFLKDTYDGTTADESGNFSFSTAETGAQTLVVRSLGYKEFSMSVNLDGKALSIDVKLNEAISELNAVTISAGSFAASDEARRTVFRAVDIATTAGATADIAGALNTLPGTQKVGESGRLFVRGGEGNEAKTYIDGLLVLDAYSPSAPNTPSRGRFLPFMFKGTSFSTGGYSAEYGQALSSILALDSKDESEITRTDFGLMSVGGDVTHTQSWEGGSTAAKLQYTNLRPYTKLINQEIDWHAAPRSLEGIGSFRQQLTKTGMLKVYGNFTRSDFSLFNHDIDDYNQTQLYTLKNDYRYVNASYKDILKGDWVVRGGLAYSNIVNGNDVDGTKIDDRENGGHAKIVAEGSLSEQLEMKTGAEVFTREYSHTVKPLGYSAQSNAFDEVISAFFAESDFYASNDFVTRAGLRTEHNTLTGRITFDPRLSLAYKAGENG